MPELDELITLSDGRRLSVNDLIRERMTGRVSPLSDPEAVTNPLASNPETRFAENALKFLGGDIKQQANDEYNKQMRRDKTGFWGRLSRFTPGFSEGFKGATDPKYRGLEDEIYNKKLKEFKDIAPLFQRDAAAQESADVRRQSIDVTQENNLLKAKNAFDALGLKGEIFEANKDLIASQVARNGAQATALEWKAKSDAAKIAHQELRTDILGKTGFEAGPKPVDVSLGQEINKDPNLAYGIAQGAFAKSMGNLTKQSGSGRGSSTSTSSRLVDMVDPDNPELTVKRMVQSGQRSSFGGGGSQAPVDLNLIQNKIRNSFGQPVPDSVNPASAFPAGPPIQPLAETPRPQVRTQTPAPVSVSGIPRAAAQPKPVSAVGDFPDDIFIPVDHYTKPRPDGSIPNPPPLAYKKKQDMTQALYEKTSLATSAVLRLPPDMLKRIGDIASTEKISFVGSFVNMLRQRGQVMTPEEARFLGSATELKMEEILRFTGKQSREGEQKLVESTTPNNWDSPQVLAQKIFSRHLLIATQRWIAMGDRGATGNGVSTKWREAVELAALKRIPEEASRLARRYTAGQVIPEDAFDPYNLLYRDIVAENKRRKKRT